MSDDKKFDWNSAEDGKQEYHEFYALLSAILAKKECRFVLSPAGIRQNTPPNPGMQPEVIDAAATRAWTSNNFKYWDACKKLNSSFDSAIGILQSIFRFGSRVRNDVETALTNRPADINEDDWTSQKQWLAAITKIITDYQPSTQTDKATLRQELQAQDDQGVNGFKGFASDFTRLHTALVSTGIANVVTDAELFEWAKNCIRNSTVRAYLASTICKPGEPEPTWAELFSHIHNYITFMRDADPYRVVTGANGRITVNNAKATTLNTNTTTFRCTRCWNKEHRWNTCIATQCGECGRKMSKENAFCPNWENHTEPGTKWRYFPRKQKAGSETQNTIEKPVDVSTDNVAAVQAARTAMNQARKILQATLKKSKKS